MKYQVLDNLFNNTNYTSNCNKGIFLNSYFLIYISATACCKPLIYFKRKLFGIKKVSS